MSRSWSRSTPLYVYLRKGRARENGGGWRGAEQREEDGAGGRVQRAAHLDISRSWSKSTPLYVYLRKVLFFFFSAASAMSWSAWNISRSKVNILIGQRSTLEDYTSFTLIYMWYIKRVFACIRFDLA